MQFVGNPYVWGGTSLTNGADCSGFTMQVFAHFGVSLSHSSWAQSSSGTRVSASEAQPGDLIFYQSSGSATGGHVGIYIGGGKMVSALSSKYGICVSTVDYGKAGPHLPPSAVTPIQTPQSKIRNEFMTAAPDRNGQGAVYPSGGFPSPALSPWRNHVLRQFHGIPGRLQFLDCSRQ